MVIEPLPHVFTGPVAVGGHGKATCAHCNIEDWSRRSEDECPVRLRSHLNMAVITRPDPLKAGGERGGSAPPVWANLFILRGTDEPPLWNGSVGFHGLPRIGDHVDTPDGSHRGTVSTVTFSACTHPREYKATVWARIASK